MIQKIELERQILIYSYIHLIFEINGMAWVMRVDKWEDVTKKTRKNRITMIINLIITVEIITLLQMAETILILTAEEAITRTQILVVITIKINVETGILIKISWIISLIKSILKRRRKRMKKLNLSLKMQLINRN